MTDGRTSGSDVGRVGHLFKQEKFMQKVNTLKSMKVFCMGFGSYDQATLEKISEWGNNGNTYIAIPDTGE